MGFITYVNAVMVQNCVIFCFESIQFIQIIHLNLTVRMQSRTNTNLKFLPYKHKCDIIMHMIIQLTWCYFSHLQIQSQNWNLPRLLCR